MCPLPADGGVDPSRSLGALVAERPARAELLERLRLDYCCGGRQTLAEACARRGVDLELARAELAALEEADARVAGIEDADWRAVGVAELCEHIVTVHHDGLREAFPRLTRLFAAVVRAHGHTAPALVDAQRRFGEIRGELEPHLASEEQVLFPALIEWERTGSPVDATLVRQHEREHAALGEQLVALRRQCGDYDREDALCNTHRALLDGLEAFELDLHRHVHEENNILLARDRGEQLQQAGRRPPAPLARDAGAAPDRSLPACCEGWVAEQTHRWAAGGRGR